MPMPYVGLRPLPAPEALVRAPSLAGGAVDGDPISTRAGGRSNKLKSDDVKAQAREDGMMADAEGGTITNHPKRKRDRDRQKVDFKQDAAAAGYVPSCTIL
jgi:hypothetical protein